ncbi:hypothetical protein QQG55_46065 [Brugia pahangi]|uniref:Uncharacterized protein n=1 Tax=Brugia pahangi TaxID=6280 RepID=A0A0N4TVJ3_BRUPA|nr:unnamed protein product [Brugia pahangi]
MSTGKTSGVRILKGFKTLSLFKVARGSLLCFRLKECAIVVVDNAQMLNSKKCAVVIMLATHEGLSAIT